MSGQDTAWSDGYRAALADVERLACSRNHGLPWLSALLAGLRQDSLIIEHALKGTLQRRRLRAAQEEPLFEGPA